MRSCVVCHRVYDSDDEPPICVAKSSELNKKICGGELVNFKYTSVKAYHEGEFNRLHTEMAEKYGIKWLSVNEALISAVPSLPEWDYYTPENKHAMTLMAVRICEKMEFIKESD